MGFPPVFTDAWDVTQPPDTQLANLLGQDFRNLKTDIMQRMSLLSGITSNMPTPETVNATWGGSGFGILFFATDTGIIWQWNGASWAQLSSFRGTQKYSDLAVHTIINPGVNTVGSSITIPANTLQVGSSVSVIARFSFSSSDGLNNVFLSIGGAGNVAQVPDINGAASFMIFGSYNVSGANSQVGVFSPQGGSGGYPTYLYNGTDAISGSITISTNVLAAAHTTYTLDYLSVIVEI
jgi:hypothetical protein